jgi:adenine-specific DNA-methyltransferase
MNSFGKLKAKLAELFQLDQADLDFGIYRIMNARREEITSFLERDLLPQVREAFGRYKSSDKAEIQRELDQVVEGVKAAGMDPEQSPKVKELRVRLAEEAVDVTALENEVYDHLYSFFNRYYDEGDFISLRRYKEGVYAIPYEGEEVKLYWANQDQYYVKTTEYFRDYAFKTPSGHRVHFKIVEADTEKDNVKAASGNERRFLLHGNKPVAEENGELVIRFEYRPDDEKRKQDAINAETARRVIADLNPAPLAVWQHRLSAKWKRADGTESDKTLLEKHLYDYTRRNTFDYFIHKDLGKFLRRELDFYIKNEVMRLDDVEEESAPRVEQYLSKVKVIRSIAHRIVEFLAQIEDFQKLLWLKKKFVVETNYCVTLDRVPAKLYSDIASTDAQRQEWVRLFAIDEIKKGLAGAVDYSEPLTVAFLKANPFLVLDTKFFSSGFKETLLASLDDFDAKSDGLLIHADNFHALNAIGPRYHSQVRCAYADPPFNTNEATFIYKNEYRHSSWCTMVRNSLIMTGQLLSPTGVLAIAIDDLELHHLGLVCDSVFGMDGRLGVLTVEIKPSGRTNDNFLATSHEYYLFYGPNPSETQITFFELTDEQKAEYGSEDSRGAYKWRDYLRTGGYSTPEERPNSCYPVYYDEKSGAVSLERHEGWEEIWPIDSEGRKRVWRKTPPSFLKHVEANEIQISRSRSGQFKVQIIDRIKSGTRPKSVWVGKQYDASSHGTKLLKAIFGESGAFTFPKSLHATHDVVYIVTGEDQEAIVVDCFAGSGTTGHAVIDLNREDEGSRKYILVEMGEHFNTALKPRIQKVVYSRDWKDGKPVSRDGVSHMFKYLRLESYEDALANINLERTPQQQELLDRGGSFRESYMLRYLLGVESKGSQTLLNIDNFDDPFGYKLLVGTGSVGETKPVNVDLVETFNWLLGLKVRHIDSIEGFRVVQGEDPKGEKVLVIWRRIRELSETDPGRIAAAREKANQDLEAFFRKQQYNTLDSEFDVVYVNGDNNLMNVPLEPERPGIEPRYKVRLIEEEFKRLMFDVKDV